MIFRLPNPIPNTIADVEELQGFYKKYGIIPQFGTTECSAMQFLELLRTLTDLSGTFNAALRDLKAYTFGLNLGISQGVIPGLAVDGKELNEASQVVYATYLAELGIGLRTITALSKRIKHHLAVSGNAYLKITRYSAGDSVRYVLEVPFYTHCAYLHSRDYGEEFLMVSPWIGDEQKLSEFPPLILRATQMDSPLRWTKTGTGEVQAILHVKADTDEEESPYYARPDIIHVLPALYTDYQLDSLSSKIAASELVSKKILAFQAPDPNTVNMGGDDEDEIIDGDVSRIKRLSPFQKSMHELKLLATQLGTHPSNVNGRSAAFVGVQYPYSGQPPIAIDIEMNRDTQYQTFQLETAVRRICAALGWAPELLGMMQAKATLGGNMLRDILLQKEISTIAPDQFFFANMWNGVFSDIREIEGAPAEFSSYGVHFPRVISEIIEQAKEDAAGALPDISTTAQEAQNTEGDEDAKQPE